MPRLAIRAAVGASLLLFNTAMALAKEYTITVSAPNHDYYDCPVSVTLAGAHGGEPVLTEDGRIVPAQGRKVGGREQVTWIVPRLEQGKSLRYHLAFHKAAPAAKEGVSIAEAGGKLEVRVGGELFTRYDTTTGPNKPYFYPIFGPDQKRMTRGYPIEVLPDAKSHDHPHHRGLWFDHGDVNGEDYWSEEPRAAKTVNTGFEQITSGPVYGRFVAHTDWITHGGIKAGEDRREVTIYNTPDGRMMDFTVTVKPVGAPLVFQDTKEGSFGIRLPDSMRVAGGDGHILMSTGVKDQEAWGKRADWVDYYGTVGGSTAGVAILDAPNSFRHPTYWHVRDYGLFAANPFGLHDYDRSEPKGAGDYTVPVGGAITFSYRVYFHRGSTDQAHVADVYNGLADPPRVEVH